MTEQEKEKINNMDEIELLVKYNDVFGEKLAFQMCDNYGNAKLVDEMRQALINNQPIKHKLEKYNPDIVI